MSTPLRQLNCLVNWLTGLFATEMALPVASATSPGVRTAVRAPLFGFAGSTFAPAFDKRDFEIACATAHEEFGSEIDHALTRRRHREGMGAVVFDLEIGLAAIEPHRALIGAKSRKTVLVLSSIFEPSPKVRISCPPTGVVRWSAF